MSPVKKPGEIKKCFKMTFLKVSADCIRRRCDRSLFHAHGPAVANEPSPNDDSVRGTATVIDSADLRPALKVTMY